MSKFLTTVVFFLAASLNVSAELSRAQEAYPSDSRNSSETKSQTPKVGADGLTRAQRAHRIYYGDADKPSSSGSDGLTRAQEAHGVYYGNVDKASSSVSVDQLHPGQSASAPTTNRRIEDDLELAISKQIMQNPVNAKLVFTGPLPKRKMTHATILVWVHLNKDGSVSQVEYMRDEAPVGKLKDAFDEASSVIRASAPFAVSMASQMIKVPLTFLFRDGDQKFKMRALDSGDQ